MRRLRASRETLSHTAPGSRPNGRFQPAMAAVLFVLTMPPVHAEIVKCKTQSGTTVYQEAPCPPGSSRLETSLPDTRRLPEPNAAPQGTRPPGAREGYSIDQLHRDTRAALEKDVVYWTQRCARGERDFCASAACGRFELDDSDANLVACIRARGLRIGDGWVATSEGELVPSVLRPDWSITIMCMKKVGGERPWARIWRKFGVPESSFNLDVEAAKACQAKYDEPRGKGRK